MRRDEAARRDEALETARRDSALRAWEADRAARQQRAAAQEQQYRAGVAAASQLVGGILEARAEAKARRDAREQAAAERRAAEIAAAYQAEEARLAESIGHGAKGYCGYVPREASQAIVGSIIVAGELVENDCAMPVGGVGIARFKVYWLEVPEPQWMLFTFSSPTLQPVLTLSRVVSRDSAYVAAQVGGPGALPWWVKLPRGTYLVSIQGFVTPDGPRFGSYQLGIHYDSRPSLEFGFGKARVRDIVIEGLDARGAVTGTNDGPAAFDRSRTTALRARVVLDRRAGTTATDGIACGFWSTGPEPRRDAHWDKLFMALGSTDIKTVEFPAWRGVGDRGFAGTLQMLRFLCVDHPSAANMHVAALVDFSPPFDGPLPLLQRVGGSPAEDPARSRQAGYSVRTRWSRGRGFSMGRIGEIVSVMPDGAAARAGLRPGDVLLAVGGRGFETIPSDSMSALVREGAELPLLVGRVGVAEPIALRIGVDWVPAFPPQTLDQMGGRITSARFFSTDRRIPADAPRRYATTLSSVDPVVAMDITVRYAPSRARRSLALTCWVGQPIGDKPPASERKMELSLGLPADVDEYTGTLLWLHPHELSGAVTGSWSVRCGNGEQTALSARFEVEGSAAPRAAALPPAWHAIRTSREATAPR